MGWWKCGEGGGLDFSQMQEAGRPLPLNAFPDRDSTENYYNGDGPADILGELLDTVNLFIFKTTGKKPTMEEVRGFLLDPTTGLSMDELLIGYVREAWKEVNEEYEECWEREPYDEERELAVDFVLGGMEFEDYWDGLEEKEELNNGQGSGLDG